jgi:hypothetical protein
VRPRRRWGSIFKTIAEEVVCEGADRICLARGRNQCQGLTNMTVNFQVAEK